MNLNEYLFIINIIDYIKIIEWKGNYAESNLTWYKIAINNLLMERVFCIIFLIIK